MVFKVKVQKNAVSYSVVIPLSVIKENSIEKGDVLELDLVKVYQETLTEKSQGE